MSLLSLITWPLVLKILAVGVILFLVFKVLEKVASFVLKVALVALILVVLYYLVFKGAIPVQDASEIHNITLNLTNSSFQNITAAVVG